MSNPEVNNGEKKLSKATKGYSLDQATAELIEKVMSNPDFQKKLVEKNIFTKTDLLRASVIKFLEDYFVKHPEELTRYIAARQEKRPS